MRRLKVFILFVALGLSPHLGQTQDGEAAEIRYFEDLPGEAMNGTPRVMRALNETEIFFVDLNQSYFISQGAQHNSFFYAFEKAMKERQKISFKVEPHSRRILQVDGIQGVSAAIKPKSGGAKDSLEAPGNPASGSK